MTQQSKMDVSKWQAARRQFLYTPALWFFYRMIEVAYLDARTTQTIPGEAFAPSNEALLARDWIARSELSPPLAPHEYVSFPDCCQILSLDVEVERAALLAEIDAAVDSDTDEAWARLEDLSVAEAKDDAEPLFDAPRVVAALDQLSLFGGEAA